MNMASTVGTAMLQNMQMGANPGQATQPGQSVEFQEKQRYCGEQVPLAKPVLNELKQRVQSMNPGELSKYQAGANERKELYF